MKVKTLAAQSCPTLWDAMDYSLPSSFAHGIYKARILEWVAIAFSRGSFRPRIEPGSLALQADSLPSEPPGKPPFCSSYFFLECNITLTARTLSWNIFSGHQAKYSLLGFFDLKKDNDQNLDTPFFSFLSFFFFFRTISVNRVILFEVMILES